MDTVEEGEDTVFFKDSFSVRDLLGDSGAVFELMQEDVETTTKENQQPNFAIGDEYLRTAEANTYDDCLEIDESLRGHPGLFTFATIAEKMTNITNDGNVKKLCLRRGIGPVVPDKAIVDVHYQAYCEGTDEPFDSTYLRGKTERFSLGAGLILPGLEIALASMKKKEFSRFLVHPLLAYGKLGIPPRIPGNAEVLFEVEIFNYIDGVEAEALAAIESESSQCFDTVFKAAHVKYMEGNEFNKKLQYRVAITKYQKVRNMLEFVNLQDTDEEERQKKFLLKIYTNLAICYNKTQSPRKACTMSQLALKIDPKYCKALFAYGRALLMLHDYPRSKEFLNRALKISPQNQDINAELLKANTKEKEAAAIERLSCARMLNLSVTPKEDAKGGEDMEEFKGEIREICKIFSDGMDVQEILPAGFTQREESFIEDEASRFDLIFTRNADKSITLTKKNVEP